MDNIIFKLAHMICSSVLGILFEIWMDFSLWFLVHSDIAHKSKTFTFLGA